MATPSTSRPQPAASKASEQRDAAPKQGARVVHLTSSHPAFDVRIFQKECKLLARAGYKVTLIAPHASDETVCGVQVRAVPLPHGRFSRLLGAARSVYREARRWDADLYHFHDPELLPAGLLLRAHGKNVVYDIHEDVPSQILNKPWLPGWARRVVSRGFATLESFAARHLSGIVAAGDDIGCRMRQLNPYSATVANYPVLDEFDDAGSIDQSRFESGVLVSFGGIGTRTCTRQLVEALALLPVELPVRLILAGQVESAALLDEVRALPGWERVDYRGVMSRQAMIEELHRASAAVVMFSPEANNVAVRSNRLFESMAARLPVITSDLPQWKDFVARFTCGVTADPMNPGSIAEAIKFLLTHPDESAAMGLNGSNAVKNQLNWDCEGEKLLELYSTLLGTHENAARRNTDTKERP